MHRNLIRILPALLSAIVAVSSQAAWAHPPSGKKLPPSQAVPDLKKARALMDTAKQKLAQQGKYACCVKAPEGSKASGCDICASRNGSCNCAANLAAGKGVCGECLAGWKSGKGTLPGVKPADVKLLHSGNQQRHPTDQSNPSNPSDPANPSDPPELTQARELLNNAKRTLVKEGRYACCIGKGGCDECAYEASCPCAQEATEGARGGGICGQCYDGWQAGIGRLTGLAFQEMKLEPMQHGMAHGGEMAGMPGMMAPFAGIADTQEASGTSWQPAVTPHYAVHRQYGRWGLMTHYNVFLNYDRQDGPRGDYQYNSTNWLMLMANRPVGQDRLQLRTMLSLEPLTVTAGGYPMLFQSGEQYHGRPLVDRQHPHDLFMELSARYFHPVGKDSAVFVYAAPSGEPALGPTAFMHRLSALDNPLPPITHHWQDSTHIEFGVLTLGAWKRNLQVEASYFTGREPDEFRYDFGPFHMDSVSGRVSYNPSRNWSLQASYGYLHSPEQLRPEEDIRRTTASASYTLRLRKGGFWATTVAFGNNSSNGVNSDSYLLESELNVAERNTLFARYEFVNKLGEELALAPMDKKFGIGQFSLGYVRDVTPNRPYQTGVGAAVTFNSTPSALKNAYGSAPMGFWLFLRIRPGRMQHDSAMPGMGGMH